MFKEFFQAVSQQAVEAAGLKPVYPDPEPAHCYWLANHRTGDVEFHEAEPVPRDHAAADLSAVIALARRSPLPAAVWYGRARVVCLLDDGTRRDQVALTLRPSPQLACVAAMEPKKPFSQRELILLLRTMFAHCLSPCPGLLELLRTVRFKSKTDGESTVKHGQRSVGKAIEQAIEGTAELPEYVELLVPIFAAGVHCSATVRLALEPDPTTETFYLLPLPGTVEDAFAWGEDRIGRDLREALKDVEVPVFYGDPGPGDSDAR